MTAERPVRGQTAVEQLRGRLGRLRQRLRKPLTPLVLTANGRSGTTWLMGLLARHPQISVYNHYPFERTQAAYFVQMYRVLTQLPEAEEHRDFRRNVAEHPNLLTRNPFLSQSNEAAAWYGKRYNPEIQNCTRQLCSDYYWHIARTTDKKRPRVFAEYILPGMNLTGTFYELWPTTIEILLVRDMRDVFCSIRAFNKKRGFDSFGREYYDSDEQYIDKVLARAADDMVDIWHQRRGRLMLIRYEDLVADTRAGLTSLLEHIGLEHDNDVIDTMLEPDTIRSAHVTSSAPAQSIEKWRRDLEPALQKQCNQLFRNYHDTFGYPSD